LAACGGGGEATERPATGDFLAEADRICQDSQRRLDRVQRNPTSTPQEAERQVAGLIAISVQALSDLRDLEAPAALDARYGRYLEARARALELLRTARAAAVAQDLRAYLGAQRRVSGEVAIRLRLARDVGLRDCSRPSVSFGSGG
jgi:hypothetical protein